MYGQLKASTSSAGASLMGATNAAGATIAGASSSLLGGFRATTNLMSGSSQGTTDRKEDEPEIDYSNYAAGRDSYCDGKDEEDGSKDSFFNQVKSTATSTGSVLKSTAVSTGTVLKSTANATGSVIIGGLRATTNLVSGSSNNQGQCQAKQEDEAEIDYSNYSTGRESESDESFSRGSFKDVSLSEKDGEEDSSQDKPKLGFLAQIRSKAPFLHSQQHHEDNENTDLEGELPRETFFSQVKSTATSTGFVLKSTAVSTGTALKSTASTTSSVIIGGLRATGNMLSPLNPLGAGHGSSEYSEDVDDSVGSPKGRGSSPVPGSQLSHLQQQHVHGSPNTEHEQQQQQRHSLGSDADLQNIRLDDESEEEREQEKGANSQSSAAAKGKKSVLQQLRDTTARFPLALHAPAHTAGSSSSSSSSSSSTHQTSQVQAQAHPSMGGTSEGGGRKTESLFGQLKATTSKVNPFGGAQDPSASSPTGNNNASSSNSNSSSSEGGHMAESEPAQASPPPSHFRGFMEKMTSVTGRNLAASSSAPPPPPAITAGVASSTSTSSSSTSSSFLGRFTGKSESVGSAGNAV
jgi:hypothetical protein